MLKQTTIALALAALAIPQSVTAQDILAEKPVHTLGEAKTWTAGEKSYTFVTDDLAKLTAVPTNTTNVYLFPEEGGIYNTPENQAIGIQGFYVDMESTQAVGTVTTTWEGAAANTFSIWVTDNEPTTAILDTEATYTSGALGQYTSNTAVLPDGTSGRYIVFQPTDATNWGWGVKIRSISAGAPVAPVLTSFTVSPGLVMLNEETTLTIAFADQLGLPIPADKVTLTVTDNATLNGNVLTVTSGNKATLSATYGETTLTADVYVLSVAPTAPAAADIKTPIYTNTITEYNDGYVDVVDYNGAAKRLGEITFENGLVARAYGNTQCVFFENTKTLAEWNAAFDPTSKGFRSLHLDIFGTKDVQGNITLEGAVGTDVNHAITLKAGEWTAVNIDLMGVTNINNMSVRFNADNMSDILLANIYFTPTFIEGDEEAPVLEQPTATNVSMTSLTLVLKATDDKNPTVVYAITDGVNSYATSGASGEQVEYTVTGLNPSTEYTFTVTASDGKNTSDAKNVTVSTIGFPAAPAPTRDADKVVAVFSAHYGATELPAFDNWGSGATASELTTENGSKILMISNYDGKWGGLVDLDCNVKDMAHLHIDLYTPAAGSVTIAPVWADATGDTPNKAVALDGGKWNSVDLDLSTFGYPSHGYKVIQLALTNSTVPELGIDNFYFWTDQTNIVSAIEDENVPVEYFTVSGVRVNGTPESGLYIRRQGQTVTKVLVK